MNVAETTGRSSGWVRIIRAAVTTRDDVSDHFFRRIIDGGVSDAHYFVSYSISRRTDQIQIVEAFRGIPPGGGGRDAVRHGAKQSFQKQGITFGAKELEIADRQQDFVQRIGKSQRSRKIRLGRPRRQDAAQTLVLRRVVSQRDSDEVNAAVA